MKLKLVDENGNQVPCLLMAGYRIGERFLEGMDFVITLEQGALKVVFDQPDAVYLKRSGIDIHEWESRALEYVTAMLDKGDEYETPEGVTGWIEVTLETLNLLEESDNQKAIRFVPGIDCRLFLHRAPDQKFYPVRAGNWLLSIQRSHYDGGANRCYGSAFDYDDFSVVVQDASVVPVGWAAAWRDEYALQVNQSGLQALLEACAKSAEGEPRWNR